MLYKILRGTSTNHSYLSGPRVKSLRTTALNHSCWQNVQRMYILIIRLQSKHLLQTLTGNYNEDTVCILLGTNWFSKYVT
jgi:hypothetical protein